MMRTLLKGLLLLFLLWRGGASLAALVGEARGLKLDELQRALSSSEEQRVRLALERLERRVGLDVGREYELYELLRERVEEGANVYCLARRRSMEARRSFTHLQILLYPRRLIHLRGVPENWREEVAGDERFYVLELPPTDAFFAEGLRPLAAGEHYRLWSWQGERR